MWLPAGVQGAEPAVVTANDQYKLRVVAPGPKSIQRTVVGPTYGGPITRMILLPADVEGGAPSTPGVRHVAYSTHDKVVGLMQLPLDGNPSKVMGLIAHPGEVTDLAVSWDGQFVLTAGGSDNSIHLWHAEVGALETSAASGGAGIEPFVAQLDGGAEGGFYQVSASSSTSRGLHLTFPLRSLHPIPLLTCPLRSLHPPRRWSTTFTTPSCAPRGRRPRTFGRSPARCPSPSLAT